MKRSCIVAVIPARMASTRFPGKPLARILGLPMIEHVRRRVQLCSLVDEVVVATCAEEIAQAVRGYGGTAVMTSPTHERCTDRVAEAVRGRSGEIIVNVQGDEPLIRPDLIEALVRPLRREGDLGCTNLMAPITSEEAPNPNLVKVVCDLQGNALYFSRERIPSPQKAGGLPLPLYKQLGIYAFRRDFLERFARLAPTPLEAIESVDMMRAVEHGCRVRMVPVEFTGLGVDTPEDLDRATALMREDPLYPRYVRE